MREYSKRPRHPVMVSMSLLVHSGEDRIYRRWPIEEL